jgi:hypothetical protein
VLKALIFLPVAGALVVAVLPVRRALLLWQMAMFFALAALGYSPCGWQRTSTPPGRRFRCLKAGPGTPV